MWPPITPHLYPMIRQIRSNNSVLRNVPTMNDLEESQTEKKPFEEEQPPDKEEPVPDETLEFTNGDGRIWLVKIPKFLMELWQKVSIPNTHLATMRVYNSDNHNEPPRISLFLPDAPKLGLDRVTSLPYHVGSTIIREYALDIVNREVENQVVISERDIDPGSSRASQPIDI